jgi:hypothetical protein
MSYDDDPTTELPPPVDPPTQPIPMDRPRRNRSTRVGVALLTGAVLVAVIGGTVAWASTRDDDSPSTASTPSTPAAHDHAAALAASDAADAAAAAEGQDGRHRHQHKALPPYSQRYDAASSEQRAVADKLLSDVRATLTAYADVDKAVAAGYRAPRKPRGPLAHYLNVSYARDGKVLDPQHPEGLVYFTGGKGKPVLLGAFFVAPKGAAVPSDAGDLVVWHTHNPSCPDFFVTKDKPCLDTRRMLHTWTFDQLTLTGRRGRTATVKVTDPFGVPFKASVERVGKTD